MDKFKNKIGKMLTAAEVEFFISTSGGIEVHEVKSFQTVTNDFGLTGGSLPVVILDGYKHGGDEESFTLVLLPNEKFWLISEDEEIDFIDELSRFYYECNKDFDWGDFNIDSENTVGRVLELALSTAFLDEDEENYNLEEFQEEFDSLECYGSSNLRPTLDQDPYETNDEYAGFWCVRLEDVDFKSAEGGLEVINESLLDLNEVIPFDEVYDKLYFSLYDAAFEERDTQIASSIIFKK